MGRQRIEISLDDFTKAVNNCRGVLSSASDMLGVTNRTLIKRCKEYPEFKRALQLARKHARENPEIVVVQQPVTKVDPATISRRPPIEDFQEVAIEHKGLYAFIAQHYGVKRPAVTYWVASDPAYKEAIKTAKQIVLDAMEHVVMTLGMSGDKDAYKLYLKTIGRTRGYVERQEILVAHVDYTPEEMDEVLNIEERL